MVKILYVIENVYFGGGERGFAQLIRGLGKERYEIYVACLPGGLFGDKIKGFAEIIPLDLRNRFNLAKIYQLAKIMKEKKIQIVHSQGGKIDFFTRIAAKMAKVPAVISTIQMPVEGYDVGLLKKSIYIMLDRLSEKVVDRFIAVSRALEERLINKHRIPREKVIVINNGIEIEEYYSHPELADKIRNEFNIKLDVQLVGVIGRLVWQKGLPYFIQAIKEIIDAKCASRDKLKFLIVGEGDKRKELECMVKKLAVERNVIFTGFRKDVKEILEALDIFVLASIREGQPVVILEVMAMSKPIVATNIEGVNETIVNGQTAIVVPPKDSHALAEAIIYLLKDREKAHQMGQRARKVVEEKFNISDKIEQHERLYETIKR